MFWITGVLGLALGVAPWVLGYADHSSALWASVILGLVVLLVSAWGLISQATDKRWEYWVIGLAGLAAFIAPFIFGYSDDAQPLWTGLILGAILVVLEAAKIIQQLPKSEPQP